MSEGTTTSSSGGEVNPIVAAILSFLIVGVGHIVILGQTKRGGIWLGGAVAALIGFIIFSVVTFGFGAIIAPLLFLIPIGSAVDAYMQADKINSGEITV